MDEQFEKRKKRYHELCKTNTRTAARVEFLQECLEDGMAKRDAAHELSRVDPALSHASAETIVYMNFSGRYKVSRQGIPMKSSKPSKVSAPKNVEDDEELL